MHSDRIVAIHARRRQSVCKIMKKDGYSVHARSREHLND